MRYTDTQKQQAKTTEQNENFRDMTYGVRVTLNWYRYNWLCLFRDFLPVHQIIVDRIQASCFGMPLDPARISQKCLSMFLSFLKGAVAGVGGEAGGHAPSSSQVNRRGRFGSARSGILTSGTLVVVHFSVQSVCSDDPSRRTPLLQSVGGLHSFFNLVS